MIKPSTEALFVAVDAKLLRSIDDDTSKTVIACAKAVYIQMAKHCNDSLTCFPSYNSLVASTCFSICSVRRAVQWLVANGYLEVIEKGYPGRNTTYKWHNPEGLQSNARKAGLVADVSEVPILAPVSADTSNVERILPKSTRERSIEDDLTDTSWAT